MSASPAIFQSLELFTGAGGLALGSHLAGFEHVSLIEWDRDSCDTLRSNARRNGIPGINTWNVMESDVRTIDYSKFGPVDLVAGGPPCQPFSIGGKHAGPGDRRDMIPEFIRAVAALTPRAIIMENVRGLLRQSFRTYFGYVILQLTYPTITRCEGESWLEHLNRLEELHTSGQGDWDLRYNVVYRSVNAANYGIPQTRERVFIVAFRADTGIEWHFPEPTHSREALLHDQWVTGEYWRRHGVKAPVELTGLRLPLLDPSTHPWRTVRDATCDLPEPLADRDTPGVLNHRLVPGARSYVGHTGSPLDWPAKTLKAGDHGVPGGENMMSLADGSVRYFTVREAARLQTFPDEWQLSGSWTESMRQLGNAVPVDLGRLISNSVARALTEYSEYNPLDYSNLTRNCVQELMARGPYSLPLTERFDGAGVYALFYTGDFGPYLQLRSPDASVPIYVGKAEPAGRRTGRRRTVERPLHGRLGEHVRSIQAAENLRLQDFVCRFLVVTPLWITMAERFLIEHYQPIWNVCLDGFGIHAPGSRRETGQIDWWDSLHPGREFARRLAQTRSYEQALDHLKQCLERSGSGS